MGTAPFGPNAIKAIFRRGPKGRRLLDDRTWDEVPS